MRRAAGCGAAAFAAAIAACCQRVVSDVRTCVVSAHAGVATAAIDA